MLANDHSVSVSLTVFYVLIHQLTKFNKTLVMMKQKKRWKTKKSSSSVHTSAL